MPKIYEIDDKDERLELGQEIVDSWDDDNEDRQDWLLDLPKWLRSYAPRSEAKDVPWEGASNLNVPVVGTVIDALHPRHLAGIMNPSPVVSMRPQEPSDDERARRREIFLDWAVREDINLFPVMDRVILGQLREGMQFVKTTWETKVRHLRDKHEFPKGTTFDDATMALAREEINFVKSIKQISDDSLEDIIKDRKVTYEAETDDETDAVIVYTEREEIVKQSPKCTIIDPEDITINVDAPFDLQDADHINHRYWMTLDQIRREVKKGVFKASDEDIERIEKMLETDIESDDNTYDIKQHRDTVTGIGITDQAGDPEKVELIDAYRPYDINDDDYMEEVIVTVVKKAPDIILRINRLEEVFRHGMRPFTLFYMFPVSSSVWCIGVPQVLEGLQEEFNVIHNQRVDAGTIGNMPWGAYKPAAGANPEKMPLEPGFLIPLDDPKNDIWMHTPSNYTAWSADEEDRLWMLVERRTKVNDLTIGRVGETQGASRTATGVQALNSQQATGFDVHIKRTQEGWRRLLYQILGLYAQYYPKGKEKRIVGGWDTPDTVVTREDLQGHMDMYFTGNSLSTDREVVRNTFTYLAQGPMAPPTQQFLMQIGAMTPISVAEWYRKLLKVFDVPGLERIITMPEMPKILTPEEVINRVVAGEQLIPQPGENHMAILQALTGLFQSEVASTFPAEITINIQNQLQLRQVEAQKQMMAQMFAQQMQAQMMAQQGGQPGQMGQPGMQGSPQQPPIGQPPQPPQQPGPVM